MHVCIAVMQMCRMYRLTGSRMVEELVAFCSTKKLDKNRVTIDTLDHLDREVITVVCILYLIYNKFVNLKFPVRLLDCLVIAQLMVVPYYKFEFISFLLCFSYLIDRRA